MTGQSASLPESEVEPATYRERRGGERSRFWVPFAAVRLPRPVQNAIDWVRFESCRPGSSRAPRDRGRSACSALVLIGWRDRWRNPFSGGGNGGTRVVTIAVATDNAQQAPVGRARVPAGRDPQHDPDQRPRPGRRRGGRGARHPPAGTGGGAKLEAVTLVPDDGWQAGIAASVLAGPADADARPGQPARRGARRRRSRRSRSSTRAGARALRRRAGLRGGRRIRPVGAEVPGGLRANRPAEIANSIDQLRQRLTEQEPQHILLVSSDQAGYAMPAAAWAARSGDPVLFTGRNQLPSATLAALRRHAAAASTSLGPESVISKDVVQQVGRVSATVQRVGATGAVQNALLFARYSDGSFGWNINDPGHGMRAGELRPATRCGGRRVARVERQVGTAAAHRHGGRPAPGAEKLPARHQARASRRIPPGPCTTTSG